MIFGGETMLLWATTAKNSGTWYRVVLEEAAQFIGSCHTTEAEARRLGYASDGQRAGVGTTP